MTRRERSAIVIILATQVLMLGACSEPDSSGQGAPIAVEDPETTSTPTGLPEVTHTTPIVSPSPTTTPVAVTSSSCGNGVVDSNEQCDPVAAASPCNTSSGERCVCCLCLRDDEPIGDHVFAIDTAASELRSSVLACASVSRDWLSTTLTLRADHLDDRCTAPLHLANDVVLGFRVPIGTICMKLFADGSHGVLDCDGGSLHGTLRRQNSHGAESNDPPHIATGQGDFPEGPGGATLQLARSVSIQLAPLSDPSDCLGIDYDNPPAAADVINDAPLVLTTGSAVSIVTETAQGTAEASCASRGRRLACGTWRDPGGGGLLVAPSASLDQLDGAIDSAELVVLVGSDGERVESPCS